MRWYSSEYRTWAPVGPLAPDKSRSEGYRVRYRTEPDGTCVAVLVWRERTGAERATGWSTSVARSGSRKGFAWRVAFAEGRYGDYLRRTGRRWELDRPGDSIGDLIPPALPEVT